MSTPTESSDSRIGVPTVGLSSDSAPAAPPSGERFGDFVLLGELGRGGMGVVYKAFEPELGRCVAVKMILAGAVSSESDLQRFHAEASAAARLHHSHIVKVHRVGVYADRHYFSMDFIDGQSLGQRIADGPLPGRAAARYLLAVAGAIHHAHEQGILHRDLKPGNILLDADDQPHVADFGLAKQLSADSSQTRTGALLGTPSYMAPEQARGDKDLTPATDVYGLGALLYELVTARPPFRGETALDTLMQVLQSEPVPPRLLNPRIDRDLETICMKCLAKSPGDRYASAATLAADLDRYLQGEAISARSLNVLDYLTRSLERSHFDIEFRPYGNVVLAFAVIVGVMHVLLHLLFRARQPAWVIASVHLGQFILMGLVLWYNRPHGLLPTTTAERLLWSVWIGYIGSCALIGELTKWMLGANHLYEGILYPYFAVLAGMAFFILGSSFWGKLYAVALAFFVLSWVIVIDPRWGALEYGGMWTVALCMIGLRLRRLGQERGQTPAARASSK